MILYSLIAKGSMVLCEYSDLEGDFTEMARIVLKSLKPNQQKQIFSKNEHVFCIVCTATHRFLVMIHQNYHKDKAFAFLETVHKEYINRSQNPDFSHGLFTAELSRMMKGFNSLDQKDALANLEESVDELNESAFSNLRKMIEREVKLDELVKKTQELTKNAEIVFKFSRNVHRATRGGEFRFGAKVLILTLLIFAVLSLYIYYQI